jgi:hypothetical protein
MEMFCPECMGALVFKDNQSVRCSLDGKEYRVLFSRFRPDVFSGGPAVSAPVQLTEETRCAQHPNLEAFYLCRDCGTPLCVTCAFPQEDGKQLCPDCASGKKPQAPMARLIAAGIMCVQHPRVNAVQQCKACGAGVCATCDFLLPGGVHVCPTCMSAPRDKLGRKRKKMLIWAYALAVWSTLGMAFLFSGALAGSKDGEAIANLLGFGIFIPSIVGTSLGCGALDRRLNNPMSLWIAAIWNGILLAIYLILIFIGMSS